ATAGDDRIVHIWEAASGKSLAEFPRFEFPVMRVVFVGDGSQFAIVNRRAENQIRVQTWNIEDRKAVSPELDTDTGVLFEIAFSPDGRRALTGGSPPVLWDVTQAKPVFQVRGAPLVTCAGFSPDGQKVAAADISGAVRIWEAESGNELALV